MTHEQPPVATFVGAILQQREIRFKEEDDNILRHEIRVDSLKMVREYGRSMSVVVGKSAGIGIVGLRVETDNHFVTPSVPMEIDGEKALVTMEEKFVSTSGYRGNWDTVSITALFDNPDIGGPYELLEVKPNDAVMWVGEEATSEQLGMVDAFLKQLERSFKDSQEQVATPTE